MNMLFHIAKSDHWQQAQALGWYEPEGFQREQFIHCSYVHQVVGVANRLFQGQSDWVLLAIDLERLDCPVVEENLEGGKELFPHIYCRLAIAAVSHVYPFPCQSNGQFTLPAGLKAMTLDDDAKIAEGRSL